MKTNVYAISDNLTGDDIKRIRKKLGMTQVQFADFVHVTKKTIERWESGSSAITGPIVTLVKLLHDNPDIPNRLKVPERVYPMRLWYLFHREVCAVIDVDERNRRVKVHNFTNDFLQRPFGREETPSFDEYEMFLESRCFPRTRDKMKLILKELDLPFYEPLMIIEKTQGKMAEDDFWIRVER